MIYGAQPTGIMATMPMPAQAAMGQFAITDSDSPMGIESLAGGQEELAQRLQAMGCLLYTSPSPRDGLLSRMPSSA